MKSTESAELLHCFSFNWLPNIFWFVVKKERKRESLYYHHYFSPGNLNGLLNAVITLYDMNERGRSRLVEMESKKDGRNMNPFYYFIWWWMVNMMQLHFVGNVWQWFDLFWNEIAEFFHQIVAIRLTLFICE